MKITKQQLTKIIKEELEAVINEDSETPEGVLKKIEGAEIFLAEMGGELENLKAADQTAKLKYDNFKHLALEIKNYFDMGTESST